MGIWNVALGLGIVKNPITDSPYSQQEDLGFSYPTPPSAEDILTEGGLFILTEGLDFITTE